MEADGSAACVKKVSSLSHEEYDTTLSICQYHIEQICKYLFSISYHLLIAIAVKALWHGTIVRIHHKPALHFTDER